MEFKELIFEVPDFPKAGVGFKDITPLLKDPATFQSAVAAMAGHFRHQKIDAVVGIESRGFMFGAPLALELHAAFVPARKAGKLPRASVAVDFSLEYGSERLEMHEDAILPNQRVLIVDDVLATGGTMRATGELVRQLGGVVAGMTVLLELEFLKGRKKLEGCDVFPVVRY